MRTNCAVSFESTLGGFFFPPRPRQHHRAHSISTASSLAPSVPTCARLDSCPGLPFGVPAFNHPQIHWAPGGHRDLWRIQSERSPPFSWRQHLQRMEPPLAGPRDPVPACLSRIAHCPPPLTGQGRVPASGFSSCSSLIPQFTCGFLPSSSLGLNITSLRKPRLFSSSRVGDLAIFSHGINPAFSFMNEMNDAVLVGFIITSISLITFSYDLCPQRASFLTTACAHRFAQVQSRHKYLLWAWEFTICKQLLSWWIPDSC